MELQRQLPIKVRVAACLAAQYIALSCTKNIFSISRLQKRFIPKYSQASIPDWTFSKTDLTETREIHSTRLGSMAGRAYSTTVSLLALVLLGAAAAVAMARPIDNSSTGRQLLSQSDSAYNHYSSQCKGSNYCVCKSCSASGLEGTSFNTMYDGYHVWCFKSGTIYNPSSDNYNEWQYNGCYSRGGYQNRYLYFKSSC